MGALTLTPTEQRYVASCTPLPDRPFQDELREWRVRLKESIADDVVVRIDDSSFFRAFPHIGMLHGGGFFKKMSVQEYFESRDVSAHNMRMYLFAKRLARRREEPVRSATVHIHECSVRVADLEAGVQHGFAGSMPVTVDNGYFPEVPGRYVTLHGRSAVGAIKVRSVPFQEYSEAVSWFAARSRSPGNPFPRELLNNL